MADIKENGPNFVKKLAVKPYFEDVLPQVVRAGENILSKEIGAIDPKSDLYTHLSSAANLLIVATHPGLRTEINPPELSGKIAIELNKHHDLNSKTASAAAVNAIEAMNHEIKKQGLESPQQQYRY